MNKTSIKNYAIWARNELISRVSQKAFEYGVEKDNIISYDAQSINGRLLSDDEKKKRHVLINEVKHKGYDQVIEEVAYTWFNRFIALRFMEANNYLPVKVRLFTSERNEFKPQIIDEALHIELLGLDKNRVITLKESNNNEELYKELLLATCNDMSRYLPGMFKPIDDYMTLLFPSNLLREDSVLGRLISDIDEDSWTDQVQIIGWLYQYYNTEPKDKVYARKSGTKIMKEEIPAVTQLFTPDWIVRYMTENSLGRLWLDGHSNTDIKSNWKYYLDEADQDEFVQAELNKRKVELTKLKPENIKFLDPCMGSGHILVYAFDVFMQIYVSEGWTEREAAKSILQNNIYGLDIDERAYQLSYFALMMKARQYNRRILSEGIIPNVMAIEESNTFNKGLLRRFGDLKSLAERVVNIFIDAKEYGSILNVEFTKEELDSLENRLNEIYDRSSYGNLLDQLESDQLYYDFLPLLNQARIMSQKYECVVTNPPYMGLSGSSQKLNTYIKKYYPSGKADMYTVFIEKCNKYLKDGGLQAMITQHGWLFQPTFEKVRLDILDNMTFVNMIHLGPRAFDDISGEIVQTAAFVLLKTNIDKYTATYSRVLEGMNEREKEQSFIQKKNVYKVSQDAFSNIPNYSIAYWTSENFRRNFDKSKLSAVAEPKCGMATTNNERFLRGWFETDINRISFDCNSLEQTSLTGRKWFPYNKGGTYRKWYGNREYIVNWENNGKEIRKAAEGASGGRLVNIDCSFKECLTWSSLANDFSMRYCSGGFMFDSKGASCFVDHNIFYILALMNSKVTEYYLRLLCPTLDFTPGQVGKTPIISTTNMMPIESLAKDTVNDSKEDWDSFENSWDFRKHPLIRGFKTIRESYEFWDKECTNRFNQLKANEEEINRIFIDIYGLQDELTPEVEDKDITVRKADLQREIKSLISYAVGCMFGRYSLDADGLAYAGGEWDDGKYRTFIPDKDNIIPICDDEYFNDDITGRFIEFIKVAYGEDTLEENLRFIADALGGKGTSREVIRNYFINDFYKDHCNTYQVTGSGKRPIYWQFDSGKKNGFKALVYIHRYTPDLIARMRTSYVHEQQSRYENQISMIQNRIDSAASTSERVKAEKELKKLKEQADELRVYEEKIHHWADKMEPMDLDDGVKANYAKFQELLTKIK